MGPSKVLKVAQNALFALLLSLSSVLADSVGRLSEDDRASIRQVIEGQMAAFQTDDAPLAFSFAAPSLQEQFGDASRFIAMVKRGYFPVYRPREVEFSDLLDIRGKPTQRVVVIGPDNEVFGAYYMMEQQPDGSWRISGCALQPIRDRAI